MTTIAVALLFFLIHVYNSKASPYIPVEENVDVDFSMVSAAIIPHGNDTFECFVRGAKGGNYSVRVTDVTGDNRTELRFELDQKQRLVGVGAALASTRTGGTILEFRVVLDPSQLQFPDGGNTFVLRELTVAPGFGGDVQIRFPNGAKPIQINDTRSELSSGKFLLFQDQVFAVAAPPSQSVVVTGFRVVSSSLVIDPNYESYRYDPLQELVPVIAGSVVAALVCIALVVCLVLFFVRRSKQNKANSNNKCVTGYSE